MHTAVSDQTDQSPHHDASRGPEDPLVHIPLRLSDAKRSVRNIRQWNAYLPTDCVRKMVSMGWDYTT